ERGLHEHLLQARGGDRDQHLRRVVAFVLEAVGRADRHVGEHARRRDHPLAVDRERDLAFEDVEAFLLPAVDVRWGTAARTHERFKEGILAVGVLAGRQEAVHVADEGDGAALLGGSDNWLHWIGFLPILRAVSSRTSSPARSSRPTARRPRYLPARPAPNSASPCR